MDTPDMYRLHSHLLKHSAFYSMQSTGEHGPRQEKECENSDGKKVSSHIDQLEKKVTRKNVLFTISVNVR